MAKIMIVDDSESLRDQLKKSLEGAGHQVIEGCDGVDGLEKLQANPDIRLVLCDVNMPRMDGLTMCQKARELPVFSRLPVVMLTTEANPEMKARGKEAGVLAWITKPYVESKLLAAVEKIARMP